MTSTSGFEVRSSVATGGRPRRAQWPSPMLVAKFIGPAGKGGLGVILAVPDLSGPRRGFWCLDVKGSDETGGAVETLRSFVCVSSVPRALELRVPLSLAVSDLDRYLAH